MTQVPRLDIRYYDKEAERHNPMSKSFSAQHTEAAERMRFRRTVKIVDKMLEEDDSNKASKLAQY